MKRNITSLLSVLFAFLLAATWAYPLRASAEEEEGSLEIAQHLSSAFERVAGMVTPSMVSIVSVKKATRPQGRRNPVTRDPFFENFREFFGDNFPGAPFPTPEEPGAQGLGTGVIIDKKGYIVTNNHVIDGADDITVRLHDMSTYRAEIVGRDPRTDLAVIKIKAKDLAPATMGDSDVLKIGEWVVAAGNPFGLDNTITAGIVSAKGRSIMGGGQFEDFIQTDAAINPGNSGGPLLNLRGEVVGINTAIFSRSGGYMGIGFAIPVNMAKNVVRDLIDKGRVVRGWLGVAIQNLTVDLAERLGFRGSEGALVGHVQAGSPSQKAGIRQGDIIVTLNGETIKNVSELRNQVAATSPGTTIALGIIRDGSRETISVKIGELPNDDEDAPSMEQEENAPISELGLSVEDLSPELSRRLRTERSEGVVVTGVDPSGLAAKAGVQPLDIIVKVDGKSIRSAKDFRTGVARGSLKKGLLLVIESQGMQRFALIKGEEEDN